MSESHSFFGPSAAHRWLECPGSIRAEASLPPEPTSSYAAEGSAAHALAELCLRTGVSAKAFLNCEILGTGYTANQEMVDNVQDYIDFVRELGGYQEYEQKVEFKEWVPEGFGTADAIITFGDTLYVVDLKYGKGVTVDAEENPQGMLYALGALVERDSIFGFKKVVIVIHQPRLFHVSSWETTPNTLYHWADWFVKPRAAIALSPEAPLIPGTKQCRFCAAKAMCPELLKVTEETILRRFDEDETKELTFRGLSNAQMKLVLDRKDLIISWLKAIETHVADRLKKGEKFEGYKLVAGRSNRDWADAAEAEKKLVELLGEAAYSKNLITVAQAEKAVGKAKSKELFPLIFKPEGAPTIARETDKRKEVSVVTADDFD